MMLQAYRKILSANDTGQTKSHQAGMLIPKGDSEFRAFLGELDSKTKNPRKTILCRDENGDELELQYIHYNNKLHDERGTRNEYRLTCLTAYLRRSGALAGDEIEISKNEINNFYYIKFLPKHKEDQNSQPTRIVLKGWRRVH
ncbi:restriction endonuclease EcoRII [Yoonia maritima]|uniref:Restriction endonuclease EcoRII n=1 Tax=Yoonia maritima TaxID=1435347 RepID=A0A2T0VUU8_9RHOB|nr:EcoRII N-terminal effector-binding domain-containing protein [Yoonia maritima]PRY75305.1 restriction endonuclease EcoRII [Yoonia maritima]